MPDLRSFPTPEAAAHAVADALADRLNAALDRRERARLIVTGGSTPAPTYRRLATLGLPWERIDVFLSDDRFVPDDHEHSNARLVRETLPEARLHAFPTALADPTAAADAFDQQLRSFFHPDEPHFDAALLGVGADAHVASLFPGDPTLGATDRLVLAVEAPPEHPVKDRLTLTLPALNATEAVFFLVTGASKREAVAQSREGTGTPAGCVMGRSETVWFVDSEVSAV